MQLTALRVQVFYILMRKSVLVAVPRRDNTINEDPCEDMDFYI
jgi:hypothetical protein